MVKFGRQFFYEGVTTSHMLYNSKNSIYLYGRNSQKKKYFSFWSCPKNYTNGFPLGLLDSTPCLIAWKSFATFYFLLFKAKENKAERT